MSCCDIKRKFCNLVVACQPQTFLDLFKELDNGNYKVHLNFLETIVEVLIVVNAGAVTLAVGETMPELNESFTYTGKIIDDAGQPLPYYNCFQFKTTLKYD